MSRLLLLALFIFIAFFGCKNDVTTDKNPDVQLSREGAPPSPQKAVIPAINVDSSYAFIEKQLSFGTRVPGSKGHLAMKDWMVSKLKSYGMEVTVQPFKASFMGKKDMQCYNIIASYKPEKKRRMLLAAHWDTRLIAEKDKDTTLQKMPIAGADDGASGVAGLLEIARTISVKGIDMGVDFIFFDAEDQGLDMDNWCLGAQYWSKNPHKEGYRADWGILLDLVGAKGATFHKEEGSRSYAGTYLDKVWALGQGMNYGQFFRSETIGMITDDHYFVNTVAKIPMIDIINTYPSGYFASYHHTHDDNIKIIDRSTLKAVIQVTTAALYKYSDGSL